MLFTEPAFLFAFLPATLALYFATPVVGRNAVLALASLAFYALGEPRFLPFLVASIALGYGFAIWIERTRETRRGRAVLAIAIAIDLLLLVIFKYASWLADNVDRAISALGLGHIPVPSILLPLGISFFTFHAISYVVDVYKRNAEPQRAIPSFALYILLFPQLIAGPIIRWRDIAMQIAHREERYADFAYGARRFVLGLGKKTLIANTLGQVADGIFGLPASQLTTPLAWLGLACYTLQIYFDFSGYSDMAIGLMRMFGFRILENFNYPYISRSIREFWRRWHISLSNWFRDYLYIPLGGNRRGNARAYANLVIVFLLCGLWHGASWPFVLWGAWHGVFLVLERAGLERPLARHAWLAHLYTLLAVMGGWVLFRCDTLAHAVYYYAALCGFAQGDPLQRPVAEFLDPLALTTLLVAIAFATPVARRIGAWREHTSVRGSGVAGIVLSLDVVWLGAVLVAASAFLAAGTYNPFIYFRF